MNLRYLIAKGLKRLLNPPALRNCTIDRTAKVCPKSELIQFPDDDTSDFNGNWNGLAEDIAREVFEEGYRGISFCTADKREML